MDGEEKPKPLRVLLVEDSEIDAELDLRELTRSGMQVEPRRVETRENFILALQEFAPDIILSDYSLPRFDGQSALTIARELAPDIPFLFVSGTIGEDRAVDALKNGAADYVIKGNLRRLAPAVTRAISDTRLRRDARSAEAELRASELRFRLLAEQAPVGIVLTDRKGEVIFVNPAWCEITGLSREASLGPGWADGVHPDDVEWVTRNWEECWRAGSRFLGELRFRAADGRIAWVVSNAVPQFNDAGSLTGYVTTVTDITQRKLAEDRIQRLNRTHAILSSINAAIVRVRERGELFKEVCRIAIAKGNFHAAMVVLRQPGPEQFAVAARLGDDGMIDALLLQHRQDPSSTCTTTETLNTGRITVCDDLSSDRRYTRSADLLLVRGVRAKVSLPLRQEGKTVGAMTLFSATPHRFDNAELGLLQDLGADISFALDHIAKAEHLDYLAFYDALTALPNRSLFSDRLAQHLVDAEAHSHRLAVVTMDIERFRHINESLGRDAGDAVLKVLAERIRQYISDAGHAARLGADSFAALVPNVDDASQVMQLIRHRFAEGLGAPLEVAGQSLRLSARAGVAFYPDDGMDTETLLRNAEAALREAKNSGEQIYFYSREINADVARRLALENGLRLAIEESQFELHYQPKFDLRTGAVTSMEALIRWNHPEQGLVSPGEFIPILEISGMIHEVGRWSLLQAMRDISVLKQKLDLPPRIAVNVSALQLRRESFLFELSSMVEGLENHRLDLEITESLIMSDIDAHIPKLTAVRNLGFAIAVDDFGTGYSSLNYIARLPVDTLKIDRTFIAPLLEVRENRAIVSSIVSLAHTLGLKVVAEGVETPEQRDLLRELDCDEGQGFLFCRPLPLAQLADRLESVEGSVRLVTPA